MFLITRLQRVGLLSLSALLLGGLVLILTGLNGLASPASINGKSPKDGTKLFRYGSQLSVQAWIAIVGVGFGLLSYGFNGTYTHLFDWWCSRQAQSSNGLDYGVYLNSQPQAPVLYGCRGFSKFITLRYLLTLASIALSIGYKFGIVVLELSFRGTLNLPVGNISSTGEGLLLIPPTFDSLDNGETRYAAWLTDVPDHLSAKNHAFFHQQGEKFQPPLSTIMTGILSCQGAEIAPVTFGTLYTRELVIVANMTEVQEEDDKLIVGDSRGWSRAISSGEDWFDSREKPSRVWVQYTSYQTDEFDVEWTKYNPAAGINSTLPVVRHVRYKMHYGVAEVSRHVESGDCSQLIGNDIPIQLLSNSNNSALNGNNSYVAETDKWSWADSMITSWGDNARLGVSNIIQVAMTIFTLTLDDLGINSGLRFVPAGTQPFGEEMTPNSRRYEGNIPYPILSADGWKATGIWIPAAGSFLAIGCFSVLVGLIRICVGPPVLTSWMGQHVFLVKSGKVRFSISLGDLASGYNVASRELGRLRN